LLIGKSQIHLGRYYLDKEMYGLFLDPLQRCTNEVDLDKALAVKAEISELIKAFKRVELVENSALDATIYIHEFVGNEHLHVFQAIIEPLISSYKRGAFSQDEFIEIIKSFEGMNEGEEKLFAFRADQIINLWEDGLLSDEFVVDLFEYWEVERHMGMLKNEYLRPLVEKYIRYSKLVANRGDVKRRKEFADAKFIPTDAAVEKLRNFLFRQTVMMMTQIDEMRNSGDILKAEEYLEKLRVLYPVLDDKNLYVFLFNHKLYDDVIKAMVESKASPEFMAEIVSGFRYLAEIEGKESKWYGVGSQYKCLGGSFEMFFRAVWSEFSKRIGYTGSDKFSVTGRLPEFTSLVSEYKSLIVCFLEMEKQETLNPEDPYYEQSLSFACRIFHFARWAEAGGLFKDEPRSLRRLLKKVARDKRVDRD